MYFLGMGAPKAQWMEAPQAAPNCPPGLEYLTQVDQLLVHQQIELFEGKTCNLEELMWMFDVIYRVIETGL